jgi:ribosomal RNA assembly protein
MTGEYFLSERKKSEKKWQDKLEKQSGKAEENKRKREAAFVPPKVVEHFPYLKVSF